MFDRAALTDATLAHGTVVRAVIAETKGSTPREAGASMLIWADGQSGTIGGGTLELDATAYARRMIERDIPQAAKTMSLGPELGQCCGGAVTLAFRSYSPATLPEGPVIATPVMAHGTPPKSIVELMQTDLDTARMVDNWFVEPEAREQHALWIYGAGHVGRAIVATLAPLPDFAITWVDTSADRFPEGPTGVTQLPAANPAVAVRYAPECAHHLILTYSHQMDLELCDALLRRPTGSIGLIGSATKWARFRKRLIELGHESSTVDGIECPIGDPLLGKHPQAIALGVSYTLMTRIMDASTQRMRFA